MDSRSALGTGLILAVVLALALAVMGTLIGAVVHERPAIAGCATSPCVDYRDYGWPWPWATNNPQRVVQDAGEDEDSYGYNQDGQSPSVFLFTTFVWFAVAVLVQAVLAVLCWNLWRPIRRSLSSVRFGIAPAYLIPVALSLAVVAIIITNLLLVVQGYERIFPEPCGDHKCASTNETYRP